MSRPPSEPGWYWAKLQLHAHRVSDWKPTWWDQPADLIAEWGPRIPEPFTPGPAIEGPYTWNAKPTEYREPPATSLEDDVRALLGAWDDTATATRWSTIELAVERLRARLGAGGGT